MNQTIIDSISSAVDDLIANSTTDEKLRKIMKKHVAKVHFIPMRYRVLGGIYGLGFGGCLATCMASCPRQNRRTSNSATS